MRDVIVDRDTCVLVNCTEPVFRDGYCVTDRQELFALGWHYSQTRDHRGTRIDRRKNHQKKKELVPG